MLFRSAVYADEAEQSSAWVLQFPGARLTLALSAETWRGFSGEGQALHALMRIDADQAVAKVRAQLNWQPALDPATLATQLQLSLHDVQSSLHILGAFGLVGFDVVESRYFHRVLPFDLSTLQDLHPRLADARALLANNAVRLLKTTQIEAQVDSGGTTHSVREAGGLLRCTCAWFAKHQGERGPCKHVLAVEALAGRRVTQLARKE